MSKYRKKPSEVVAYRIGDDVWPDEIFEGVTRGCIVIRHYRLNNKLFFCVDVSTIGGTVRGDFGDWIIRPTGGKFQVMEHSAFTAAYEPVTDERAA